MCSYSNNYWIWRYVVSSIFYFFFFPYLAPNAFYYYYCYVLLLLIIIIRPKTSGGRVFMVFYAIISLGVMAAAITSVGTLK